MILSLLRARRPLSICAAAGLLFALRTPSIADPATTLTLYASQHAQTINLLINDFKQRTGITVKVHRGDGPQIANQIATEGASSPADVYLTENSPELVLLSKKHLLAPVDPQTLAQIPARYNSPNGDWVGVLARENVLAYNPAMVKASDLPASLMDLAKPSFKGKIAIAPTDGDFLPLVSAVAASKGKDAAVAWLKGLKTNAQIFDDDEGVVAAVNRGAVAMGIINNYYWARLQQEVGKSKMRSTIYHFTHGDIGGLINVSGAGVLKSSKHQAEAQKFLAYIVSAPAQSMLAKSDVDFEYPLHPGVAANPVLKPFSELQPPAISVSQIGDDSGAAALLREAGLL